jgi:hypothetical protein
VAQHPAMNDLDWFSNGHRPDTTPVWTLGVFRY